MSEKQETHVNDAALIAAVRDGSMAAYGLLYAEFRPAALRRARRMLPRHQDEAEDVVEMAFASILDAILNGSGPVDNFARYLMVTLRHTVWRTARRRDREPPIDSGHLDELGYDPHEEPGNLARSDDHDSDTIDLRDSFTAVAAASTGALDPTRLLTDAFAGLSERHRAVLWITEVEGTEASEIGALLGMSTNAASALRYRARRSLRSGYFSLYARNARPECLGCASALEAFIEAERPADGFADVLAHLEGCPYCTDVVRGAAESSSMLSSLAPVGFLSAGYWLRIAHGASPGGSAAGAAGAAAAAGRAGGVVSATHATALSGRVLLGLAMVVGLVASTALVGRCTPDKPKVPEVASVKSNVVLAPEPSSTLPLAVTTTSTSQPAPPPAAVGSLAGVIRIDRDGAGPQSSHPAAGVPVMITPPWPGTVRRLVTGIDGHFSVSMLPPGRYGIDAMVPVGLELGRVVPAPSDGGRTRVVSLGPAPVDAGQTRNLVVEFAPWRTFSLTSLGAERVADKSGDAVTWRFGLGSTPATATSVDVIFTLPLPSGATPLDATATLVDPSVSVAGASSWPVPCEQQSSAKVLRLRCRVPRLTPARAVIDVRVPTSMWSSGLLQPTIGLTPVDGFVNAAEIRGSAVRIG